MRRKKAFGYLPGGVYPNAVIVLSCCHVRFCSSKSRMVQSDHCGTPFLKRTCNSTLPPFSPLKSPSRSLKFRSQDFDTFGKWMARSSSVVICCIAAPTPYRDGYTTSIARLFLLVKGSERLLAMVWHVRHPDPFLHQATASSGEQEREDRSPAQFG